MAVAPESLLRVCPCCGYALDGLPVRHVCPECGRQFDREAIVFGGMSQPGHSRQMARGMRGFLIYKLTFVLALIVGIGLLEHGLGFNLSLLPGMLILGTTTMVFAIMLVIGRARSRCVVMVSGRDVRIVRRLGEAIEIPLSEILSARHEYLKKRIVIESREKPYYVSAWELAPFDLSVPDACIRSIRARIEHRAAEPGKPEGATVRPGDAG